MPNQDELESLQKAAEAAGVMKTGTPLEERLTTELKPLIEKLEGEQRLAAARCSAASWNEIEPPKDGTTIVAIGRVIWHDDLSTSVDSFTAAIRWIKDTSGYTGWHFAKDGMTVARALDDEVMVDWWVLPPNDQAHPTAAKTGVDGTETL